MSNNLKAEIGFQMVSFRLARNSRWSIARLAANSLPLESRDVAKADHRETDSGGSGHQNMHPMRCPCGIDFLQDAFRCQKQQGYYPRRYTKGDIDCCCMTL